VKSHVLTAAALAAGLLAAGVFPSTADALPPVCPGGEPPPCDEPEPTPTTTPPPPNPGTPWRSRVSVLDQSETGFRRNLTGNWRSTGSPVYSTQSGTVQWTNADQNEGTIAIPNPNISVAPLVGFHLFEAGQDIDGELCRSTPIPKVPLVLATTHVLVAETETVGPAELTALADGFVGDASTPEAEIRLDVVTIEPVDGGLALRLEGWMFADGPLWFNAEGDFRYTAEIHLLPSERSEVQKLVVAHAENDALVIFGEDADIEAEVLPKFRKAVVEKVEAAVNSQAASRPEVQWFASLGFTTSFRDVSIDPAGIHVDPSLCKVG
jgi:hypothetical protein